MSKEVTLLNQKTLSFIYYTYCLYTGNIRYRSRSIACIYNMHMHIPAVIMSDRNDHL